MPAKFEEGSLAAMVNGGGLAALRAAGKDSRQKVLAIYYAQSFAPAGWIPEGTKPDESLSSGALATWLEDLAYDVWRAMDVSQHEAPVSFVPPGAFVCQSNLFQRSDRMWAVGSGAKKPNRLPDGAVRYDGRTDEALDVEGKVVIPKKKRGAAASGSPSARRSKRLKGQQDQNQQESEANYAVDEGAYIESCVGKNKTMLFTPGTSTCSEQPFVFWLC